jgi:hypothetical protein
VNTLPIVIKHVDPDISDEENQRRINNIEDTISSLLDAKVTITISKDEE